ncbi:uncharacterized protein LOC119721071 [Patiria miniata]|uniref:Uncharacterized protein n=1 Tax=Patiria miniata TaxID=46514 RepID=A0A913Z5C6_PATMI|nr:uncharacterized protein LOC119721071 [Patiria miniata]
MSDLEELGDLICSCLKRRPLVESWLCLQNTMSEATAAAVYTMIYTIVSESLTLWCCASFPSTYGSGPVVTLFALQNVDFCVMLLASILVLVGVWKESKIMLIPFIGGGIWMFVIEVIAHIVWMANVGPGASNLTSVFVFFASCLLFNILSVVFVISHYQTLTDASMPRTNQVGVIVQEQRIAIWHVPSQ